MAGRRVAFVVIGVIAALVYFYGLFQKDLTIRQYAKPVRRLPALLLAFLLDYTKNRNYVPIALMIVESALNARTLFSKGITVALVFSIVGDICLETQRDLFLPGLVSFLIGHIGYIVAFMNVAPLKPFYLLPFLLWGAGAFFLIREGLGDMMIPVIVYTAVLGAMAGAAASTLARPSLPGSAFTKWAPLLGGILFVFSDTLIAVGKFYYPEPRFRYPIMLTYYLAQFFFTWTGLNLRFTELPKKKL